MTNALRLYHTYMSAISVRETLFTTDCCQVRCDLLNYRTRCVLFLFAVPIMCIVTGWIHLPRDEWRREMRYLMWAKGILISSENEISVEPKAFVLSRNIGTRYKSQVATANLGSSEVPSCPPMGGIPILIHVKRFIVKNLSVSMVSRGISFVFSLWLLMLRSYVERDVRL
jgi:hypothetical protein